MQSPTSMLIPALLFGAIGIVIGVVVALIIIERSRNKSDQKASQASDTTPTEPKSGLPPDRYIPIARLLRERASGRLAVEVDESLYLSSLSAPQKVRDLLENTADDFDVWLGKPMGSTSPAERVEAAAPAAPITAPEPVRPAPIPEAARSTSIVDQINEVLQEMLEQSSLSSRKIFLAQEPSFGVVVWVDGVKYPGVDTVAEADVKNLIKDAVKKWERKNDPGNRYP